MRRISAVLLLAAITLVALPASADPCYWNAGVDTSGTPVGVTQCYDVRPGSPVTSDRGSCTLNFVFSGSDGNRYIGTAGHCIIGGGHDTVFASPGPVARSRGRRIGEFAYAVLNAERDFALIRLDPGVAVDPELSHFGGPTGVFTDHDRDPFVVHHYGHGVLLGGTIPARSGIALGSVGNTHVYSTTLGVFGDSGSGVIDDSGRAVGVLVTLGVFDLGTNGISRLDYQLPRAESALGIGLTLLTAPLRTLP